MPRGTQEHRQRLFVLMYGTVTLFGSPFQYDSTNKQFYHSDARSYNPATQKRDGLGFSAFARHY